MRTQPLHVSPLGAVKTIALPASIKALVRTNLRSIESRQHTRLLQPTVQTQVPSVGELTDANALLRRREVVLRPAAGSSDHGAATRAVCYTVSS